VPLPKKLKNRHVLTKNTPRVLFGKQEGWVLELRVPPLPEHPKNREKGLREKEDKEEKGNKEKEKALKEEKKREKEQIKAREKEEKERFKSLHKKRKNVATEVNSQVTDNSRTSRVDDKELGGSQKPEEDHQGGSSKASARDGAKHGAQLERETGLKDEDKEKTLLRKGKEKQEGKGEPEKKQKEEEKREEDQEDHHIDKGTNTQLEEGAKDSFGGPDADITAHWEKLQMAFRTPHQMTAWSEFFRTGVAADGVKK